MDTVFFFFTFSTLNIKCFKTKIVLFWIEFLLFAFYNVTEMWNKLQF